ncbi:bifunctional protein-serine/threonine kinase/phosphatase [Aliidiomarina celeris]|uniref:bifunctional protein-serine/threonine kinase/phosphatase n=1 Tax=Aliidiomarina celeris TaxID=2249428 RepID=UPI000DE998DE|nr:bifunctional protein-serine/threonine kinase/phosphatase [Aliidiomarina celeris]
MNESLPKLEHELQVHVLCRAGGKESNEDFADSFIPDDEHIAHYKGYVFAVADGVSSAEAGQQASETAVTHFIHEYPKTPDTWSVSHAAEQLLSTINSKLYRHSHAFSNELKGHLCTFSSLILKSRTAHLFHVGDSRIYRLRDQSLEQLTQDHKAQLSRERAFLARALGMDNRLQLDYRSVSCREKDIFLLCSDGIHDFLSEEEITTILCTEQPPESHTESLYAAAMQRGCDDNISVIVLQIQSLPAENIDDYSERLTQLPFPPPLTPGQKIDGYEVLKQLFMSSRSHLYLVKEPESNQNLVMKTPSPNYSDDPLYIERFIREEWIGLRIENESVVKMIRPRRPKTFLYYLMEFIEGESLEALIEQSAPLKPGRVLKLIDDIYMGLEALHSHETIHQDLKPGNIIVTQDGRAKIIDFGSVYVAGLAEIYSPVKDDHPLGTAEYSDPLYLMGKNSGIQGDVYALATIAYELFTGKLPYGEAIAECRVPRDYERLRYISAREVNPKIPLWLDRALEKGVKFDLQERYTTLAALLRDIRKPNPEFLKDEVKKETQKSSLLFWQLLSGFWFVTLLLVIYLFVLSR